MNRRRLYKGHTFFYFLVGGGERLSLEKCSDRCIFFGGGGFL